MCWPEGPELESGGAERDRTVDLLSAIQGLSQTELQPHPFGEARRLAGSRRGVKPRGQSPPVVRGASESLRVSARKTPSIKTSSPRTWPTTKRRDREWISASSVTATRVYSFSGESVTLHVPEYARPSSVVFTSSSAGGGAMGASILTREPRTSIDAGKRSLSSARSISLRSDRSNGS